MYFFTKNIYCINDTAMKIIVRILINTSIQCGLLLSMYMDSTWYTIMYNNNTGMYHEP